MSPHADRAQTAALGAAEDLDEIGFDARRVQDLSRVMRQRAATGSPATRSAALIHRVEGLREVGGVFETYRQAQHRL